MRDTRLAFNYSNLPNRPAGRITRISAKLFSGAQKVQAQIVPYAEAWNNANLIALAKTGPLWVVLGDSMSQGIGASSYDSGWVGQLHGMLQGVGEEYRVVNLSISGARVLDILERQLPAMRALASRVDLVTVLIGSNDMANKKYRRDLVKNYRELLQQLPAKTVIVSPFGNFGIGAVVNKLIQQQAPERGIIVVENKLGAGISSWKGKLATDHFHPNNQGYRQLALVFFEALVG